MKLRETPDPFSFRFSESIIGNACVMLSARIEGTNPSHKNTPLRKLTCKWRKPSTRM